MTAIFKTNPGKPSEHDFSVTRDQWEYAVFNNAAYFQAVLPIPGNHQVKKVKTFTAAVRAAQDWRDAYGRTALIYAVTASGRSVCLDREAWPALLKVWKKARRIALARE